MKTYVKLIFSLALVSGLAAGLLSFTNAVTSERISRQEQEAKNRALNSIFFLHRQNGRLTLQTREINDQIVALYDEKNPDQPVFYAVIGSGIGYNASVPVEVLVGFTNPQLKAAELLAGYVEKDRLPSARARGLYIVGFTVVKSEETPGLGEKIRDNRPAFSFAQLLTGTRPPANPDRATAFQAQFRGRVSQDLKLRKNGGELDAITAATITTNALVSAMQDAAFRLQKSLAD